MFERRPNGVFQSSLLNRETWLDHGFGSRKAENWPGDYRKVRQIHSATVASGDKEFESREADAIVISRAGRWVGIRTADCVPILLADPVRRCVAAVHAGWRGTLLDIAGKTVRRLQDDFATDPGNLIAAIGPCIGRCCYEVGSEVSDQFRELFPEAVNLSHIDLVEANRRELVHCGIRPENIDAASLCTSCEPSLFDSFRRDREQAGRMVAAIRVEAGL